MPLNSPYSEYIERAPDWQRVRDVGNGARAVKAASETYLPRPEAMEDADYRHYVERAGYFNGYGRALQGLHGMVFRKNPTITIPPVMQEFVERATISDRPLHDLARWCVLEELGPGRLGLLVDVPRRDGDRILTASDVQRARLTPYIVPYRAEDILSLEFGKVHGRRRLTRVRLAERTREPNPEDEWETDLVEQWRVLDLVELRGRSAYRVRVYRETENSRRSAFRQRQTPEFELIEEMIPTKADGRPWGELPFVVMDADGEPDDGSIAVPPLLDLADKTIELYQVLADLRHGLFMLGFPQTCIKLAPENFRPVLGGTTAWMFDQPEADAWILRHDGSGLEQLKAEREELRREIALLGARMLEPDSKQVEAAATAMIHRQGELSVLQALAIRVSAGISRAMQLVQEWQGIGGELARIDLNQDYIPAGASAQETLAIWQVYVGGGMLWEEWRQWAQDHEIIRTGYTPEEARGLLDAEQPELPDEPPDLFREAAE